MPSLLCAGMPTGLIPLLSEERKGEVDALDFPEPAFVFSPMAPSQKVAFDFIEARQHLRMVGPAVARANGGAMLRKLRKTALHQPLERLLTDRARQALDLELLTQ